jgi:hypothetical protein
MALIGASNYRKGRALLTKIMVPIVTAASGIMLNIDAMPANVDIYFFKWLIKSISPGLIPLFADFTGKKSQTLNDIAQERNEKLH